jgi:hypothetical protein
MSRADRLEVPGLIDSLRLGDKIVIETSVGNRKLRTYVSHDSRFVHTKDGDDKFRQMWHRYSVLKTQYAKRPKLYTDLTQGFS